MLRYLTRLAAAAVALLAGLLTLSAASAAAPPLPKIQAYNVDGWSGMVKRPSHIILGNGGSPEAYGLSWSRWASSSGKATGKLDLFWCFPASSCQPSVHSVTVWANTPRTHRGLVYFAHLIYQYVNAKGVTKQLRLWFYTYPGATVPGWH